MKTTQTKSKMSILLTMALLICATGCNNNAKKEVETVVSDGNTIEIIAINGSPRTDGNTATMCNSFLEGASAAAENVHTAIINLYELDYKGCESCFGCKRKDDPNYGHCIIQDEITDLIEKISQADGVVFASPIYLGDITGEMRSFLERLLFPYLTYEDPSRTIAPKRMPTAIIYTMNVSEEGFNKSYDEHLQLMENVIGRIFLQPTRICAFNTYQFDDYDKYHAEKFPEKDKAAYKAEHWKADCQKAFDVGKAMVEGVVGK